MRQQCNFCSSTDIVLRSGYVYCRSCSRKIDRVWIHNIIMNAFSTLPLPQIQRLCIEMFGISNYCFAEVPRLYEILERGEWIGDHFEIPQDEYLVLVFKKFLEINHPILFRRITNEF